MAYQKTSFQAINQFLPANAGSFIAPYFNKYSIKLVITKQRKIVNGLYKAPLNGTFPHEIQISGQLNPYSFLVTFLHELAHLEAFVQYGNKIFPHGKEWKLFFSAILKNALFLFPLDIETHLRRTILNPKATTFADTPLFMALSKYDINQDGKSFLKELSIGDLFETNNGMAFKIMEKRRTRYLCEEILSGKKYTISAVAKVVKIVKGR